MTSAPLLPPAGRHDFERDLQRGDTTMTHVKKIALPVALAAALAGQPLAGAEDVEKPPTPEQTARDVKDLKKSSDEILLQLKAIQEQLKSVEGVKKDIEGLKAQLQTVSVALEIVRDANKTASGTLIEARADLKQLREDLDRARAQAARMEKQLEDQTSRCDGLNREI